MYVHFASNTNKEKVVFSARMPRIVVFKTKRKGGLEHTVKKKGAVEFLRQQNEKRCHFTKEGKWPWYTEAKCQPFFSGWI